MLTVRAWFNIAISPYLIAYFTLDLYKYLTLSVNQRFRSHLGLSSKSSTQYTYFVYIFVGLQYSTLTNVCNVSNTKRIIWVSLHFSRFDKIIDQILLESAISKFIFSLKFAIILRNDWGIKMLTCLTWDTILGWEKRRC